ncbi:hypothetical protein F3Y22_tig00111774pilonHSYRG00085 [Hibiscus syriacus]|uniref:Uncharacterized protein n=1 Tax=Hibiscus syriacus TaxID=106335 RepID=A0A6A2YH05_HIBSY|nr:hypothetical protein F3Y22_tig00111774pilonHSYRG00085 [Hibiscus syriacus]
MEDDNDNEDDFVFDDDDLTWSQVSRVAEAQDPSYLTRASTPTPMHDDEIEEDIGENEEYDGNHGDSYKDDDDLK